jgi:hypothetical protein
VDRGPGTIVCDLNAPMLPHFPPHDVCVFSGVLEYVNDLPRLVRHLHASCGEILASYAPRVDGGVADVLSRRRQGWVSDYDADELIALFAGAGFRCERSERIAGQRVFSFVRNG